MGRVLATSRRRVRFSAALATLLLGVCPAAAQPPANDLCVNATPIIDGQVIPGTLLGATVDGSTTCTPIAPLRDVWYTYSAHTTGNLRIRLCGADNEAKRVSLHTGCPGTAANQVGCTQMCGHVSCATPETCFLTPIVAGTIYQIRVANFNTADAGPFSITLNAEAATLPNDNCADATPIGDGTFVGSTVGANVDGGAGCVTPFLTPGPDVWFRYTAPATGSVAIDTCGSAFWTVLSFHSACPGTTANQIACGSLCGTSLCGPGTFNSCLTRPVVQGESFLIRLSGNSGAAGNFVLHVRTTPCAEPPVITTQPRDRAVCAGSPAVFEVRATGVEPLSYSWRHDGQVIPTATGPTYTIAGASPADAGRYDCEVRNACGTPVLSHEATLGIAPCTPGIVRISASATGANTGTSWADAITALQDGIGVAVAGSEVWVAAGTYRPAPPGGSTSASFGLPDGVGIYGAFAGTETSRAERDPDPAAHVTILSGDLNGDDGPNFTNINDNSNTVVVAELVGAGAVLDRFTITGGYARGSITSYAGGGVRIVQAEPTITACVITRNRTADGAGSSENPDPGGPGAGIYCVNSSPLIAGCTFYDNHTGAGGAGGCTAGFPHAGSYGGPGAGIYLYSSGGLVRDCFFLGNITGDGGAGAGPCGSGGAVGGQGGSGAGIYSEQSSTEFVNCIFAGGYTGRGGRGGGSAGGTGAGGGNGGHGAGIVLKEALPGASITNCTLMGNRTGPGGEGGSGAEPGPPGAWGSGGGVVIDGGTPLVHNSILWENVDMAGGQRSQIDVFSGTPVVRYCDIQGLTGTLGGVGNVATDPSFVDPYGPDLIIGTPDDNYRLLSGSDCIDAAERDMMSPLITTDAAGLPRFVDDTGMPDAGPGPGPVVDMGAYEFQGTSCYPNCDKNRLNGSSVLNVNDYICFQTRFALGATYADCDNNDVLNVSDFICFQTQFALGCPGG